VTSIGVAPLFIYEVIIMTRDDIKEMVKQVISDMTTEYGLASEITAVGNMTANVGGYDGPLGKVSKRKLKDFEFSEEEDEKE
jgi:hypothetical protein